MKFFENENGYNFCRISKNNSNVHSRIIYYTGVIGNGERVIIHS